MLRLAQQFTLPNGRRLGYDEHGTPAGQPIFYFHGTPSARIEWTLWEADALIQTLHLRIITVDRPGMGLSDFQPGRCLTDWPSDVAALADHLRLDRFAVLGFSGGVSYAAACATRIPDRLTAVGLVGVVGPFDQPGLLDGISPQNLQFFYLNRDQPRVARLMQRMMALAARFAPDRLIAQAMPRLAAPDQALLASPKLRRAFIRLVREALQQGPRGPQVDTALIASPWDFDLAEIQIPVYVWHGAHDRNTSSAMVQYWADMTPQSHLRIYPEEGHLSIMVHRLDEILRTMVGSQRRS